MSTVQNLLDGHSKIFPYCSYRHECQRPVQSNNCPLIPSRACHSNSIEHPFHDPLDEEILFRRIRIFMAQPVPISDQSNFISRILINLSA